VTKDFQTLSFRLSTFPFEEAEKFIASRQPVLKEAKRVFAFWLKLLIYGSALAALATWYESDTDSFSPWLGFWIGVLIGALTVALLLFRASRNLNYFLEISGKERSGASFRAGIRQIETDAEGIVISSDFGRWAYPWSNISAVVSGPSGVALMILTDVDFLPIPAESFADEAERDRFVTYAERLRTSAMENLL
jgi:hypothetical protein